MGVKTFRRLPGRVLAIGAVALLPSLLFAQDTGTLVGTVSDSTSRAPLAAVLVNLSLSDGDVVRSALTGPGGTFRIDALAPGEYDVQASLPGWQALLSPVVSVAAGSVAHSRLTMVERPYRLNPLTVSVSRSQEKVLDAPAAVEIERHTIEAIGPRPRVLTND